MTADQAAAAGFDGYAVSLTRDLWARQIRRESDRRASQARVRAISQARETRPTVPAPRFDTYMPEHHRQAQTPSETLLQRVSQAEGLTIIPGETDLLPDVLWVTPEMARPLSVVPMYQPDPSVTDDTWEVRYIVRRDSRTGTTHAREIGSRFTLRGWAPTFEGRTAEHPTVLCQYPDGTSAHVHIDRFRSVDWARARAYAEELRRESQSRPAPAPRELTMREIIRARDQQAIGGSQAQYD
jgi:hypothetical protein